MARYGKVCLTLVIPVRCRSAMGRTPATGRPVTMEYVTTAIVVTVLVLVGIGIVINELLRLRAWLKNSPIPPSEGDDTEPPDGLA
ncbi:hypothetical protein A4G26_18195 [Mycobacterium kansasii]|uniref:Uncharacterized protein n=1 Tax=Mycobacterium innocens TaxID=2341083 RepID=A0A498QIM6_9MYCO|nr:hypothetical protein A4G26_18195 [Mycobacterium kansasii]VBA44594.1 hypothetical protein LAUMK13_05105 [Mycobacterium innocens]